MPLRINLYHEALTVQAQRKRDPLKLGGYVLGFIGLAVLSHYMVRMGQVRSVVSRQVLLDEQWAELGRKQKEAAAKEAELAEKLAVSDGLAAGIEGRFHWAPLMAQFSKLVPREIQVLKFSGDLRDGRICNLSIEGIAAGPEPRKVAEEFRIALADRLQSMFSRAKASFSSPEDGTSAAVLDGNTWPTATFTISAACEYRAEQGKPESAAKPAAAPAPPSRGGDKDAF